MPTNNRRRTIACLLRHINMTNDPNWSSVIACLGATSREKAVLALADLIEPEERTCRNIADETYKEFGEPFKCSECGADPHDGENFFCGFSSGEHDWRFCPNCGARVIADD